tara:strand:+ start:56542 stop:56697 length:156 start_codon:yes stop_codon:yes gene_type:complete
MSNSLPDVIQYTVGVCCVNPGMGGWFGWGSGWMGCPVEMKEFKLKIAGNYV